MPPETLSGSESMTENLSPHDAARLLAQTATYEDGLVQRTEGITTMLWALVGPAIFLSYGYAEHARGFPTWGWSVLWAPWVLAGALVTYALWRSAALTQPRALGGDLTTRQFVLRIALVTLLISVIFALWDPRHFAAPLLVLGALYLVFALFNPWRTSRRGRRAMGAVGVAFLATAAALAMLPETGLTFLAAVGVSGAAPLAAGLWQTLRG